MESASPVDGPVTRDVLTPGKNTTATVERVALPPVPPPVRSRRFAVGAPPPPPNQAQRAVAHRRSPQASANPAELLGPAGFVATSSSSTRRALVIVGLAIVAAIIAGAVIVGQAFENTAIINNLERGECVEDYFRQGANGEYVEVFLVQTAPCSEAHALEVYAVTDLLWNEQDYPGIDETFAVGQNWCFQQYDSFVGGDYETSPYDVWTFVPIEGSWSQGDRSVRCLVGQYDEVTLTTGSLEGAGW